MSQPLPMVAAASNSPAHSETTTQQHPDNEKSQDALQKEALDVVDSLFVCSIPEPGCDYKKIVTEDQVKYKVLIVSLITNFNLLVWL